MIKSVVTHVRKASGLPGRSDHNGRGGWELMTNAQVKQSSIYSLMREHMMDWQERGWLEHIELQPAFVRCRFKAEMCEDAYYREVYVHRDRTRIDRRHGKVFAMVCFSLPDSVDPIA